MLFPTVNLDDVVVVDGNLQLKLSSINFELRACESTALIDGKRFCKECKKKQHPKKAVDFQDSDAICAGSCGADKLTFREVLVGSCCEDALMETPIINTGNTFRY